jgi:hypothetical protein
LIALIVYLFASAPPPLTEHTNIGETIPIEVVFAIVEAENDVVRALYTKEIVGPGQAAGLAFNENWREDEVQAGPLPALFLRETAMSLEKDPVRLSLFLGSDFPVSPANQFKGKQMELFQAIRAQQEPQFFYAEDTQLYTAMFPDVAVAQPCVTCHNGHEQSPKHDWQLNDIMGATTWTYPANSVTLAELMEILTGLRQGFRDAYSAYLTKTESFSKRPEIADKWPRDGYYLPTVEVFMAEVTRQSSAHTLEAIMKAMDDIPTQE